jgi:hypothetical protein
VSSLDDYLEQLRRALPAGSRPDVLAEVEDHLRESSAVHGEEEALARFGPCGAAPHERWPQGPFPAGVASKQDAIMVLFLVAGTLAVAGAAAAARRRVRLALALLAGGQASLVLYAITYARNGGHRAPSSSSARTPREGPA